MSKKESELAKNQSKNQQNQPEKTVSDPKNSVDSPELITTSAGMRTLSAYNCCPICGTEGRDNGHYQKGAIIRIYFECQKCGHDWTADTRFEVVRVDHRLPENITSR